MNPDKDTSFLQERAGYEMIVKRKDSIIIEYYSGLSNKIMKAEGVGIFQV